MDFLFHLFMHGLIFVCDLIRDRTCNLGVSGYCSNQLSYLARVVFLVFVAATANHSGFCEPVGFQF